MAKVQALLRRAYDFAGTGKVLECGGAVLDLAGGALVYGGERVELEGLTVVLKADPAFAARD